MRWPVSSRASCGGPTATRLAAPSPPCPQGLYVLRSALALLSLEPNEPVTVGAALGVEPKHQWRRRCRPPCERRQRDQTNSSSGRGALRHLRADARQEDLHEVLGDLLRGVRAARPVP